MKTEQRLMDEVINARRRMIFAVERGLRMSLVYWARKHASLVAMLEQARAAQ
jgi:hypothetical protein